jgi:hypothetical protein
VVEVLSQIPPAPPALPGVEVDERVARDDLREQIARLERKFADALPDVRPGDMPRAALATRRGPRLLTLGELERVRDDLADRLAATRHEIAARAEREADRRVLLEKMLRHPARYKWVRVTNGDLHDPGCVSYHVKPRLGLIGMLAGWWHVKVSSGCPLAAARAR